MFSGDILEPACVSVYPCVRLQKKKLIIVCWERLLQFSFNCMKTLRTYIQFDHRTLAGCNYEVSPLPG